MGRSFSYVKYSFPDFGFAEIVVAYGIPPVHSRVKRSATPALQHRDKAKHFA